MPLEIRSAVAGDYPAFVRLFAELAVPDPIPSAEHFEQQILGRMVVAEVDEVVGYGSWRLYGPTMHVFHIAVDRRCRGRGVGRALMEHLRGVAIAAGCTRWYLNVKRDNTPALRLYEACGMRTVLESWALEIAWSDAARIAVAEEIEATVLEARDDGDAAARFELDRERLAMLRGRPGVVMLALRERGEVAGVAAFDPAFPGAFPFRVVRPELAGALLAAMRAHADPRFDFVRMTVEGDWELVDALVAVGAKLTFELLQLAAAIDPPR